MLAKKYLSQIVSIHNPFMGIYTLEIKSLGRAFKYAPGQFLHIAIDQDYDGVDQWPESRCFSMQSNPDEEVIRITYAVKGSFTKKMEQTLNVGSEIWIKLPYGDLFTQQHSKEKTVFIAGGTGVTPYLSLFTHASFNEYSNPRIYLGFRSQTYNIYDKELDAVESDAKKIYYEDTDGILDIKTILTENTVNSCFFISGPPAMIKSFKNSLVENGVPNGNVLTDDWE